jgi:DSF synthase
MFICLRKNVQIKVDGYRQLLWLKIGSERQVHYSYNTVCDMSDTIGDISSIITKEQLKYVVMISANQHVWNMGGDLELFERCIRNRNDIAIIKDYAYKCINVVDGINKSFFNDDVVVISAIQGNAFGGGFECALAGNYIIAEEQVKFRFPEVLFGSFPGMGAYSFLTRRVGFAMAHQMIRSGTKWSSASLLESGTIDAVCEKGSALKTALKKIEAGEMKVPGQFEKNTTEVPKSELLAIVNKWLDETLSLNSDNVQTIKRIIAVQKNSILM